MPSQNFDVVVSSVTIVTIGWPLMLFHMILVLVISQFQAANKAPSESFVITFVPRDVQVKVLLRVIDLVAIFADETAPEKDSIWRKS